MQQEAQQPDYTPTATVKDLMDSIIDPSADVVWNDVMTSVDASGTEDKFPRTDEEWADVRRGAIRLVESSNLLLVPGRHVAGPGEKSVAPGVELEPLEMEALISEDPEGWNVWSKALHNASLAMLQAIDPKDPKRLFDLGGRLDAACEGCHRQYWYPNEVIPPFPSGLETTGGQ